MTRRKVREAESENMNVIKRNNVSISGPAGKPIVFVHGFGCNQEVWRELIPTLETHHRTIRYDLTGLGNSDLSAYDLSRYRDLKAHAEDLLEICEVLDLQSPVVVAHSVGASIAVLAANMAPGLFSRLVLLAPSPCFLNGGDYEGGFSLADIESMLDAMEGNYLGWSAQMAPIIAGEPPEGNSSQWLTRSFCRTEPRIAQHFGRVTFLADNREDVAACITPALIVQATDDALAPRSVGEWMVANMAEATLVTLDIVGHCPHLTAPAEIIGLVEGSFSDEGR